MFRLQGIDPASVTLKSIPDKETGHMIGNAMSLNVVERILRQALIHIGVLSAECPDRWEDGIAYTGLRTDLCNDAGTKSGGSVSDAGAESVKHVIAYGGKRRVRRMLLDSGASWHMVNRKELTRSEASNVRPSPNAMTLNTANGQIEVSNETDIWVHDLECMVTAFVLDNDCPCLISMGQLVEEHDIRITWQKGSPPIMEKPDGTRIRAAQEHNIPLMCTSTDVSVNSGALPNPDAGSGRTASSRSSRDAPKLRVDHAPTSNAWDLVETWARAYQVKGPSLSDTMHDGPLVNACLLYTSPSPRD